MAWMLRSSVPRHTLPGDPHLASREAVPFPLAFPVRWPLDATNVACDYICPQFPFRDEV